MSTSQGMTEADYLNALEQLGDDYQAAVAALNQEYTTQVYGKEQA